MGMISSQLFHLPGGGSEKWAPFVQSLGWQMEISISISRRIVETPRESSRIPEKPWEAQRNLEKPWENARRPGKPLEASRRTEETQESSTGGFSGHFEFREGFVISSTVRMFASRASENYGLDVKERNRSETRSFFHVIRLYCYPDSFSNISGYNIHLHYMILLYIEHWKVVM